tara:strand:+ start:89 stop:289 length:201 start_codon:yes stop_codon:yes gene_type:complete
MHSFNITKPLAVRTTALTANQEIDSIALRHTIHCLKSKFVLDEAFSIGFLENHIGMALWRIDVHMI